MRSTRRAFAVLLILTLAVMTAGCGKKKGETDEEETKPSVTGQAGNVTETPDEPVTNFEPSKGLVYAPTGENLTIVGIGSCTDRHLVIPSEIDGKKVISIAEAAFAQNLNIERVTIPAGVTFIDKKAFRGCRSLRKVDWPSDLERIGESAFYGSGLVDVSLPDSVKVIGASAFAFCEDLKSFRTSAIQERIAGNFFDHCTALETVVLNDGLKEIGSNAFDSCTSLQTVSLPDSIETICDSAFSHCTGLTSVKLPKNLMTLENRVFTALDSLQEMTIAADAPYYMISGNCLVEKSTKAAVAVWGNNTIPADGSVSEIGAFLFQNRTGLGSIVIPEGITAIQVGAFQGCTGITKVTLPASLQKIQVSVFEGSGLKEVVVPAGVTTVYTAAFAATPLTKAEIAGGVTDKLTETFRDCKDLKECRVIGNGVTLSGTFAGCSKLTDLTLGGISAIREDTFKGCQKLREITYEGTCAEWEAIEKNEGWDNDIRGVRVHCTDGDI